MTWVGAVARPSSMPSTSAALGVDAHQVDLRPIRGDGGAQGGQTVAGDAFGPNPLFLLGLVKAIHDALEFVGPAGFDHAMDQHAVNIIGVKDLAMAVNGGERRRRVCRRFWTG